MTDVGAQKDELTTSRGHPRIFVQLDSLAWQGWAKNGHEWPDGPGFCRTSRSNSSFTNLVGNSRRAK
jgi:hypothetical protein